MFGGKCARDYLYASTITYNNTSTHLPCCEIALQLFVAHPLLPRSAIADYSIRGKYERLGYYWWNLKYSFYFYIYLQAMKVRLHLLIY